MKPESILYFRVPDIHAAHEALSARGAAFVSAPHMIHRHEDGTEEWMAFFNDPDGRPLALMSSPKADQRRERPHQPLFEAATPEARTRLEAIRAEAEKRVPGAERCIAYQMPALRKGRVFVYFAAFKKHIDLPAGEGTCLPVDELAPYAGPKGNLIFPLKDELPLELIGRAAEALAAQYGSNAQLVTSPRRREPITNGWNWIPLSRG